MTVVMAASSEIRLAGAFYEHFQGLLSESIPDCSPAEVQGVLTGLTCAGETDDRFDAWGALLVSDSTDGPGFERTRDALCALMTMIQKSLSGRDFSFRPLLPPDTDPIADRAQAMAQWCHGFGMGLHWNGLVNPDSLETDAREAITDISQCAHVDAAAAQSDDENALTELEEYLKVAAQLIFEATETAIPAHRVQ